MRKICLSHLALFLSMLIMLSLATSVQAQSGRHVPKRSTTDPPTQPTDPAEPEPSEKPASKPEPPAAPKFYIMVVSDTFNTSLPQGYFNLVLGSCVQRLQESSVISVSVGKELNRKQASDKAKSEKELYVVWLQFEIDSMGPSSSSSLQNASLNFAVYSPGTGKVKTQGSVGLRPAPQKSIGIGGVGIPLPTTPGSRAPIENSLKQSGSDAADRILSALDVAVPFHR